MNRSFLSAGGLDELSDYVCLHVISILYSLSAHQLPGSGDSLVKANAQHVLQRLNIDNAEISWSFFTYCLSLSKKLLPPLLQYSCHPSKSSKEQIWIIFHSLSSSGVLQDEWVGFCVTIDLQRLVIQGVLVKKFSLVIFLSLSILLPIAFPMTSTSLSAHWSLYIAFTGPWITNTKMAQLQQR